MILDTSAIVGLIFQEPDGDKFAGAIRAAPASAISAATTLETRTVLYARRGAEALAEFEHLLVDFNIEIIPVDAEIAAYPFTAFRRYGKGQGHPAQLNLFDCLAYATAKSRNEPLLFKGDDFSRTDVLVALT